MREVVITRGTYGHRIAPGRVQPVSRGESVLVPEAEADRLVSLGVAAYTGAIPAPDAVSETTDKPVDDEISRLERMSKSDLEKMAKDLGVDISGAKNNQERAALIAAAEAYDNDEDDLDLNSEDIVR